MEIDLGRYREKIEKQELSFMVILIELIIYGSLAFCLYFTIVLLLDPFSFESFLILCCLIFMDIFYVLIILGMYHSPAQPMEKHYIGGMKFTYPLPNYDLVCRSLKTGISSLCGKCMSREETLGYSSHLRRRIQEFSVGTIGVTIYVHEVAPMFKDYFGRDCRIFLQRKGKRDDPNDFLETFTKYLVSMK